VLSGDDDVSKIDASTTNLKALDGDDAEGEGASSVELIAPDPIGSKALVQTDPSAVDRLLLLPHLLMGTNKSVCQPSPSVSKQKLW
jgi:hypothetical protein